MRRSGMVRARSFAVIPGEGRAGRRELVAELEDRLTATAREIDEIRAQVVRLLQAAEREGVPDGPPVSARLLTVARAAVALGLGESTVHSLIRTGHLGSRKIGGARRVPFADLDAFVSRLPSERCGGQERTRRGIALSKCRWQLARLVELP